MSVDSVISFARRYAFIGLVGSGVLWVCFFAELAIMFHNNNYVMNKQVMCADHLAFYTGARLTRFGHADRLYDYHFVGKYQNDLFAKDPVDPKYDVWTMLEAFRNPPFYALVYWPTCGWPYMLSACLWLAVSLALAALGTWWLIERRFWWAFAWVLSFLPTFAAIDYGQNTPISFALFAAVFVLLRKQMPFAAGLVAGFLLFKPQLLLGLGVWALFDLRRKWPCAVGVLIAGVALAAVSIVCMPEATKGFRESFGSNLQFDSFEQHKMHNPLAFARLLLPAEKIAAAVAASESVDAAKAEASRKRVEGQVRLVHNLIAGACSLAGFYQFWKLWRARRDDVAVMMGGVVFLTLWSGPHALIYEWMLLAATGLLWAREWRDRPHTWFALYAAAWGVLYFTTDLNYQILKVSPVTIQWSVPVLGVVGWYAVKMLTESRSRPPRLDPALAFPNTEN